MFRDLGRFSPDFPLRVERKFVLALLNPQIALLLDGSLLYPRRDFWDIVVNYAVNGSVLVHLARLPSNVSDGAVAKGFNVKTCYFDVV